MVTILQVFYSVFSGLLLSMAIPNELYLFGFPLFTVFALVPYYLAIKLSKNYKYAFLCGFCQAFTTHIASSFWLAFFKDFAAITLGASAIGTGGFGGLVALLLYLPYASEKSKNKLNSYSLSIKFTDNSCFRVLFFAVAYTIYEWIKSNGFLGYPWGTISSAMYKWPIMMQIADITGIYGIGFLFAFANALIAELFDINITKLDDTNITRYKDYHIAVRLFSIIFFMVFAYGVYHCSIKRIPQKFISTILVQQNSDPWKEKSDQDSIIVSEKLTRERFDELWEQGKSADLIVWSEGVLKSTLPNHITRYERTPLADPFLPFIKELNTPLLTGGSWVRTDKNKLKYYYNSAIVFDGQGNIRGHYAKNHLVPCAEAIPFMEVPAIKNFMSKVIHISAGWTPGDQYVFFDIPCSWNPERILPAVESFDLSKSYNEQLREESKRPSVKISTPICFDDCFPDIMGQLFKNGSEVFMNITDDSWSLKKSSEYQHFVNASYSAIEYRTTLVRSTNAGYSVVLDPTGKILAELPLFEQCSLAYDVPVYERKMTTYARFGNWLPYLFLILCAIYSFFVAKTFYEPDYVPSERKIKHKKKKKKHSKK